MERGIPKFLKVSKETSHKCEKQDVGDQRLQEWRSYLAKNLDKNPNDLLSTEKLRMLHSFISKNGFDIVSLNIILRQLQLSDDCVKASRLLNAFLEPSQEQRRRMEKIICHRCNNEGHTVCNDILFSIFI